MKSPIVLSALALSASALSALALAPAAAQEPASKDGWTQEELERVTAEIEAEVEELRGLEFRRPVAVSITDAKGFIAKALARMEEMLPGDAMELEEANAKLLGLIPADMDMMEVTLGVLEEQVGGFYMPSEDAFYLMSGFDGDLARIILSHELTHALDDQHYDLDGGFEERIGVTDRSLAYQAVVEGSGTAIMSFWTQGKMLKGELDMNAIQASAQMGTEAMSAAPPYVWKPLLGAYICGQRFLDKGYRDVRRAARKADREQPDRAELFGRAFQDPPRSTEQILHPAKYWLPEEADAPRAVEHVYEALPDGWEELDRDVLGELVLALVVADQKEREPADLGNPLVAITLKFTNDAAEGWGGDELLLLARGEARAADVVTVWDSAKDAAEFRAALEAARGFIEPGLVTLAGGDAAQAGMTILEPRAEDEVRFVTWHGAGAEEIRALTAAIRASEEREE